MIIFCDLRNTINNTFKEYSQAYPATVLVLIILTVSTNFLKFLFIFRERGREGEREGKKHQCVVASRGPPTGDQACNPGMCPDWESNQ